MAKGGKQPGAGRPAGVPNRATTNAREAIAAFVEGNVDRLNGWLDQIAQESPKDAFDAFMKVVEYNIPKLNRTDVQQLDKDGKPADAGFNINIRHVKADAKTD